MGELAQQTGCDVSNILRQDNILNELCKKLCGSIILVAFVECRRFIVSCPRVQLSAVQQRKLSNYYYPNPNPNTYPDSNPIPKTLTLNLTLTLTHANRCFYLNPRTTEPADKWEDPCRLGLWCVYFECQYTWLFAVWKPAQISLIESWYLRYINLLPRYQNHRK